ncbi:MAG: RNA-binding cell elongation regulator Jag/EloR [Actinomycetota bacterium]
MKKPEGTRAEKATEFLGKILRLMELKAELQVHEEAEQISIEVQGEDLGVLIGTRGRTLNALQALVNLAANKGEEEWRKVIIDVGGYREQRRRSLEEYAQRMAERAIAEGDAVVLEPMNSFERRVIHAALTGSELVETSSEGEEPLRRVIISPRRQEKPRGT